MRRVRRLIVHPKPQKKWIRHFDDPDMPYWMVGQPADKADSPKA